MQKEKYDFFWGGISASERNVKSKKKTVFQIKMDPKNKSSVINSRGTCVCYYCGLRLNRHKLKECTQNALPITKSYILLNINIDRVIFCVGCSVGCLCLVLLASYIYLYLFLGW